MSARFLAHQVITSLLNHQGALHYNLNKSLQECPEQQRALLQQMCYGTMRHMPQLQCFYTELVKKPIRKKDNDIIAIILLGLYQLYKMRTAQHAAIGETVEICKKIKKPWACGLVNAVLRKFSTSQTSMVNKLTQSSKSFKYNHPDWFIDKLSHNWPEHFAQIFEQNDQHPPLTLRINFKKVSRETFEAQLDEAGIGYTRTAHSPYGITLDKPTDVNALPGFDIGAISVQDEAAQLAATLVQSKPGERILDACSAPGGKLIHLLETSEEHCVIEGLELEEHRIARISENLTRTGLECTIHHADATSDDWWNGELYDHIICDAPCSASGVIRRNPDIKHLRRPEDIHTTAQLQRQILSNLWTMLKPGGSFIYATCSVFPQENEKQIQWFVKENSNAQHIAIDAHWGLAREYGRQLFPTLNGNDGFYYAKLIKLPGQSKETTEK
ncbi:MAG: 16S rRNA (cytosine(967)-C(5))-methyltransferase RsmB [Pseudomonadales bacterium]